MRIRSCRMRPRSTSATAISGSGEKRSVSASRSLNSKMPAWPSQARSVVELTGARGGISIGRDAARGLRRAQQAAHFRLADRDVAGGEVEQDLGSGERRIGARRVRHPQILADLNVEGECRVSLSGEQQIAAKGRFVSGYFDRLADDVLAGGELPPLVKFPVIRQIDLGHDAEQRSAMDDHAAIVEMSPVTQRRPDDKDREEVAACGDQSIELPLHFVEHRVLEQQIIDRIGGNSELREHHQGDAGLVARSKEIEDIVGVLPRIGDCDMRNAGSKADEFVAVRRKERGHSSTLTISIYRTSSSPTPPR